ncbi:hypothetical protein KTS45_10675 [Halomicroarcula limicola]|uniref:Uncharacterized protein n=1 Tax=Haloarcula limicola TaxID=1429915 RepID=A0A8J7Y9R1_9EURY|nr:hypothetical protein [Halomicroarcula limicola]MBV0924661.1 hypothetical protein [Halomicroarcula limicola]
MSALSTLFPIAFALGLALVHLFAGRLTFLDVIPRSRWLSLSGGSAVAYVFVHILPEIQSAGTDIDQTASLLVRFEHHVYLIALLGFTGFYGIEQYVRKAKARSEDEGGDAEAHGVFWVHIGTFTLYNVLIGYLLLHREESGVASLAIFFVAMALHFFVNDYGLREYHGSAYRRYGRWALAAAVFAGLGLGYVVEVSELLLAVLFALLAGGIVLNVIKEELPAERKSRFWAFLAGVVGYTALLLSI